LFQAFCYRPEPTYDLTPTDLDVTTMTVDVNTLQVGGSLSTHVTNSGSTAVSTPFTIIFFEDLNSNNQYDPGQDALLGFAVQPKLGAGATTLVSASVSGTVRFVGDLVHVMVDSDNVINEIDETNNIHFAQCTAS
jgi:hypothetical protein